MKKYILLLFWGLTCTLNAQEIKLDVAYTPQQVITPCKAIAAARGYHYSVFAEISAEL